MALSPGVAAAPTLLTTQSYGAHLSAMAELHGHAPLEAICLVIFMYFTDMGSEGTVLVSIIFCS